MAQIKPLKGYRYNPEKVNISNVVAPPYDVISPSMQERFYAKDKHNIVRLILGKEEIKDTGTHNKYTRAKKFLNNWINKKVFKKDKKFSIYIYTQQYLHKSKKRTRIGFIALMKIEDPKKSGILPHEYTLDKPKADRMNLIKTTKANLSPIFSLFQDKENKINHLLKLYIKSETPLFSVDAEGVLHKVWQLDKKALIQKIRWHMLEKKIFIADGHHRYEVALSYRNSLRNSPPNKNAKYVMMYFSNLSERGNLTILSTHRVVRNIGRITDKVLIKRLTNHFNITKMKNIAGCIDRLERAPRNRNTFGMYKGGNTFYLVTLKKKFSLKKLINSKKTYSLKRLDVTILHDLIMSKLLCVKKPENNIKYIHNEKDAVKLVQKGEYEVAFFLKPTRVTDMKNVAEKGEMMPQKSTYFYPKLLTGLVINKF